MHINRTKFQQMKSMFRSTPKQRPRKTTYNSETTQYQIRTQHKNNIEELKEALSEIKTNKAPGISEIALELIKILEIEMKYEILMTLNICQKKSEIPHYRKVIRTLKDDTRDSSNYLYGNALLTASFKLYERMLKSKLRNIVESPLEEI